MFQFLLHYLVYPLFEFTFGWLGDHLWVAGLIVALIAIAIWRFAWPVVQAFNTLFGWKGWALLGVFLLTFGAFGAGWRAHRDSIYPLPHSDDTTDKRKKPRSVSPVNDNTNDPNVMFPNGDNWLKSIFNGNRY